MAERRGVDYEQVGSDYMEKRQLRSGAAGWVLLNYGSGPIKGFAVMLLVGCFTHLFVNMWVTRVLFDWVIARKKNANIQTLSI